MTTADPKIPTQVETEAANLKFFNYHEIFIPATGQSSYRATITHFPNPYITANSTVTEIETRVVRVPLVHQTDYPQFSTVLPGHEPAAVLDPHEPTNFQFVPVVKHQGQCFGLSSVSPLSLYLTPEEFTTVVEEINKRLKNAFYSDRYVVWDIVDMMTFGIFRWLFRLRIGKGDFDKLEEYIQQLNQDWQKRSIPICLISLRRSGFLSLDFQIPRPNKLSNAN